MSTFTADSCSWADRVSAHLDGELPPDQIEMLQTHLKSCRHCLVLVDHEANIVIPAAPNNHESAKSLNFPLRATTGQRVLLAIVGTLILLGSLPAFGRGNTGGNTFHDLRHLAIWQVAIGVAAITAAITFRLSRLLASMLVTFLILTIVATLYDLVTGHRGPWTDPLHIVEVVAVLVVLRLVLPYRRLSASVN